MSPEEREKYETEQAERQRHEEAKSKMLKSQFSRGGYANKKAGRGKRKTKLNK